MVLGSSSSANANDRQDHVECQTLLASSSIPGQWRKSAFKLEVTDEYGIGHDALGIDESQTTQ